MDLAFALTTFALVHLMAVISPGPAFLLVSRTALEIGRPSAFAAAFGMGSGVMVWAIGALVGLTVVFQHVPWLYTLLRIVGGAYLVYLAVMAWRGASEPLDIAVTNGQPMGSATPATAFRDGVLNALSNPKVAVFFGSIFAAVIPPAPDLWLKGVILGIVFVNEVGWYMIVGLLFSSPRPRAAYARFKGWIDRGMALVLGAIGARLVADATIAR